MPFLLVAVASILCQTSLDSGAGLNNQKTPQVIHDMGANPIGRVELSGVVRMYLDHKGLRAKDDKPGLMADWPASIAERRLEATMEAMVAFADVLDKRAIATYKQCYASEAQSILSHFSQLFYQRKASQGDVDKAKAAFSKVKEEEKQTAQAYQEAAKQLASKIAFDRSSPIYIGLWDIDLKGPSTCEEAVRAALKNRPSMARAISSAALKDDTEVKAKIEQEAKGAWSEWEAAIKPIEGLERTAKELLALAKAARTEFDKHPYDSYELNLAYQKYEKAQYSLEMAYGRQRRAWAKLIRAMGQTKLSWWELRSFG